MNDDINQYVPIADFIAKIFGNDCEVVLHDLRNPTHSVVYTVNNHVTNRQTGQSFDHLVPQVILSKKLENDMVTNYYFKTPSGRLIKSSTLLLTGSDNKVFGAICVNIDTTKLTTQIDWLYEMLPNIDEYTNHKSVQDTDIKNTYVNEIVDDLIDKIIADRDVTRLSREDKLDIVRFMDERGIFLMKGAVDKVSLKMGISRVTLYSYIDEIKDK